MIQEAIQTVTFRHHVTVHKLRDEIGCEGYDECLLVHEET